MQELKIISSTEEEYFNTCHGDEDNELDDEDYYSLVKDYTYTSYKKD